MVFQTFEPGDGARYLIAADRLTLEQTAETGLAEVFLAVAPFGHPLVGWVFRDGEHQGFLEFNYFVGKMTGGRALLNSYDTTVTYHIACELLGRPSDEFVPQTPEQMDWRADWRDLLAEMKGELNREGN
jgi:hypothetical protein